MTNALWLAVLQSLITIGAVVLLWSLHLRLVDRPVFKWWAWAWTSFALYLGVGALAVPLSPEWTLPKITVVVLGATFGFLPPPLLVFGARSMLSPDLPTRREQRIGLGLVMALGVATILLSVWWSDPIESFYVRIAAANVIARGGAPLLRVGLPVAVAPPRLACQPDHRRRLCCVRSDANHLWRRAALAV